MNRQRNLHPFQLGSISVIGLLLILLIVTVSTQNAQPDAVLTPVPQEDDSIDIINVQDHWDEENGTEDHDRMYDDLDHSTSSELPVTFQFEQPNSDPGSSAGPSKQQSSLFDLSRISISDFYGEFACLAVLALCGWIYVQGRKINSRIALETRRVIYPLLCEQFAMVGRPSPSAENPSTLEGDETAALKGAKLGILIRDGPADYLLSATGRSNLQQLTLYLRLQPRQDALIHLFRLYNPRFGRTRDSVELTAFLPKEGADSFVLAILPKRRAPTLLKTRWDLSTFAKPITSPWVQQTLSGGYYVVLSDAPGFVNTVWGDEIFRQNLTTFLGSKGDELNYLILSDGPKVLPEDEETLVNQPRRLTLSFNLANATTVGEGRERYVEVLESAVKLIMDLVDYLGEFGKLSGEDVAKTNKVREAAKAIIAKAQTEARMKALAEKKLAEKKAKDEEAAKAMSPEEYRKYEEKQRRRDMKKDQKKKMKKGIISL